MGRFPSWKSPGKQPMQIRGPWRGSSEGARISEKRPDTFYVATSSSIFYRIIRAGIAVFCLLGLKAHVRVQDFGHNHPIPFLQAPKENADIGTLYDTMWHYFAQFHLKICYCSWPPNTFKFLRHVVRAILPVRPKCSHRCVSPKEPL